MGTSTARQTFRELVAEVAARAKERLPEAVNGRIEGAVKLVLAHDVTPQADGSIEVGSCTDPLKVYTLAGQACTCKDFTDGKAPEGWCRHRIAAGIDKRVRELLPQASPVETGEPVCPPGEPVAHTPPLGEAPCSVNCHVMIGGRTVQVTLRGYDEGEVLTRLGAVLQRYPHPQPQAPASQGEGWCAKHGLQMTQTHKDGRSWWSHKTDQGWCKGR